LYVFNRCWGLPFCDRFDLLRVHTDARSRYDQSKVLGLRNVELALANVNLQASSSQLGENTAHMFDMFFQRVAEYQHVIEVS